MLPPVFQTLKASTEIKAIVGTNPPRIWKGTAPQRPQGTPQQPYITWMLISGVPELNLSDPPPADRQTVQVDCWHTTEAGAEALAELVRDTLEPVAHVTQYESFSQEPETLLHRFSITADFFGR
jgi:hypothetical protein